MNAEYKHISREYLMVEIKNYRKKWLIPNWTILIWNDYNYHPCVGVKKFSNFNCLNFFGGGYIVITNKNYTNLVFTFLNWNDYKSKIKVILQPKLNPSPKNLRSACIFRPSHKALHAHK